MFRDDVVRFTQRLHSQNLPPARHQHAASLQGGARLCDRALEHPEQGDSRSTSRRNREWLDRYFLISSGTVFLRDCCVCRNFNVRVQHSRHFECPWETLIRGKARFEWCVRVCLAVRPAFNPALGVYLQYRRNGVRWQGKTKSPAPY